MELEILDLIHTSLKNSNDSRISDLSFDGDNHDGEIIFKWKDNDDQKEFILRSSDIQTLKSLPSNLRIEIAKTKTDIARFAKLALENRVHFQRDHGCFMRFFEYQQNDSSVIEKASAAFIDDKIVAIALKHQMWGSFNFGLYVKSKFRRLGLGRMVFEKLLKSTKGQVRVISWSKKQTAFYEAVIPSKRRFIVTP